MYTKRRSGMSNEPDGTSLSVHESDSIMTTILDIVADREETDVESLPPLYDAVDPDALETIFGPTREGASRTGRLEFTYNGYVVTVVCDRDGSLNVSVGERNAAYRWFQDSTAAGADAGVHLD